MRFVHIFIENFLQELSQNVGKFCLLLTQLALCGFYGSKLPVRFYVPFFCVVLYDSLMCGYGHTNNINLCLNQTLFSVRFVFMSPLDFLSFNRELDFLPVNNCCCIFFTEIDVALLWNPGNNHAPMHLVWR